MKTIIVNPETGKFVGPNGFEVILVAERYIDSYTFLDGSGSKLLCRIADQTEDQELTINGIKAKIQISLARIDKIKRQVMKDELDIVDGADQVGQIRLEYARMIADYIGIMHNGLYFEKYPKESGLSLDDSCWHSEMEGYSLEKSFNHLLVWFSNHIATQPAETTTETQDGKES